MSPDIIPDSSINTDPSYWYSYKTSDAPSSVYNSSIAWLNVPAFYNFWKESQEVIQPSNLNAHRDLEIGDVIQLQHARGGEYYHSMVLIDKDSFTVYLTGNSNDRERMDIREIASNNNIRAIKFTRPVFNHILPTLSMQIIRPSLNHTLAVIGTDSGARLSDTTLNLSRANTVYYVPEKDAYRIDTLTGGPIFWTGEFGVGNLRTDMFDTHVIKDNHDLWILEPLQNGLFIIRSWIDPSLVWDVHNYTPSNSTPVKIEKLHPVESIERNAQRFFLERF